MHMQEGGGGFISIPFYFWVKKEEGRSGCRDDGEKQAGIANKKLLVIDRKRRYRKKKLKSWALKCFTANIPATNSRSLPPISSPLIPLAGALGSKQGGSSERPLSPLEAPTVSQGAQGAQRALVNAFQESGSGEGGGEAEGGRGLALRDAASSRDVRGTGRAEHENAHKWKKTNITQKKRGFWSEHRGTREGSKQRQETCDAIVLRRAEQEVKRWGLIKGLQTDYNVCVCIRGQRNI